MFALIASLVALLAAPLLSGLSRQSVTAFAALDGAIRIVVAGVVLLHVLPEGAEIIGGWAFVALILGTVVVFAFETLPQRFGDGTRAIGAVVAGLGLFGHGLFDGVALASGSEALAAGVILHTLPVGFAVWRTLAPLVGPIGAFGVLIGGAVGTAVGFGGGDAVTIGAPHAAIAALQCAVGGTLLHALVHAEVSPAPTARGASGLGALVGAVAVALFIADPLWLGPLTTVVLRVAPPVVAGHLLAGLLHAWHPGIPARWLSGRGRVGDAILGASAAMPVPSCSSAMIPAYEGWLESGASRSGALSALAASPGLGPTALLVSFALLGLPFTAVRVFATWISAVIAGILLGEAAVSSRIDSPASGSLEDGWRFAFVDVVDHTGPWLVAGVLAAAVVHGVLPELPPAAWIIAGGAFGLPIYVCAAGAVPLAAAFISLGLPPGAALAFLVTSPASNIVVYKALSRRHGSGVALGYAVLLVIVAVIMGLLAGPHLQMPTASAPVWLGWFSAAVLAALYVASLWRQGVAGFVSQLLHPFRDHAAGRGHSHDHEHAH